MWTGSRGGGKVGKGGCGGPGEYMDGGWVETDGWEWCWKRRLVKAWDWEVKVEGGSEGSVERRWG